MSYSIKKAVLESARRVDGAFTDFSRCASGQVHKIAGNSSESTRWLPEVDGAGGQILRYGDSDTSIGGSSGAWRQLDSYRSAHHRMDDAPGFMRRWNQWRSGNPEPQLHHVHVAEDGGIDSAEGSSWIGTAEIVPGDQVSVDGGPPGAWTDGIDEDMRDLIERVNREVGPTVSACAGHHHPDSDSKRRLMRFVCSDGSHANEMVDKLLPAAKAASTPAVQLVLQRGDVLSKTDGQRYPMILAAFERRAGVSDEKYFAELGPMTETFAEHLGSR
ncbi:hypothetical protein [Nocardia testacea]|uniref:hypothetical protein n=1 Tax=Nocardia testacea TaxID=248551 RepID=UPI0005856C32|nr:hypothetical protein [Nocardia testacea]